MTIFDIINSVAFTKKKIEMNCDDESQFSPFMLNRWLSFHSSEVNQLINETANVVIPFEQKKQQYEYYYYMLPKVRYKKINYMKKQTKKEEKSEEVFDVDFICRREYIDNLELLKEFTI